jgi:ethanolamine ammonia-lyase small subunit
MTAGDVWTSLRQLTPARLALGRAGDSLPTKEVLNLALAHARARDAVHSPFDPAVIEQSCRALGLDTARVHSAAANRGTYLRRPDLGRRLGRDDAAKLHSIDKPFDLVIVVADGLAGSGVELHAPNMLAALKPHLAAFRTAPVVIAEQARVALADEIGGLLGARMSVVLIGERPGLSSPDSLGIYLTLAPKIGRTDAERNCISNIRSEGLDYETAARRLAWLMQGALRLGRSGVDLKDDSGLLPVLPPTG